MHPKPGYRRQIIEAHLDPNDLKIVEIGALNAPTFPPDQFSIRFIDYATREKLIEDNKGNPAIPLDKIVEVHYPLEDPSYSQHIPERFDIAIANHVIEHVPDTIRWLSEVCAILNPGGYFFLSIPDRRYTFDYLKRESSIVDLVRAYLEKQTRPTAATLFEHYYYRRPLLADDCWNGAVHWKVKEPGMPIKDALRHAMRASEEYTSTHCHIFTKFSFEEIFARLQELGMTEFEIADIRDVDRGANEFHVLLRKTAATS